MQKKPQLQHRRRRRRRQPVTTTTSSNSNNKNNNTCNYTQALCPQKEIHMFKKIPPWDRRPEPQVPDGRLSVGDGLEGVKSKKRPIKPFPGEGNTDFTSFPGLASLR